MSGATQEFLNDHGIYTHDQIAEVIGLSRARVQQIERIAMAKCYDWCMTRGLRIEDVLPIKSNDTVWPLWH